jgi:hypothetical protein
MRRKEGNDKGEKKGAEETTNKEEKEERKEEEEKQRQGEIKEGYRVKIMEQVSDKILRISRDEDLGQV